jgi:SAM-dependent methyltransferase
LGKRVLRPGGAELTGRLLDELSIGPADDVVEIASGHGPTARAVLARNPASYVGIDRSPVAAGAVTPLLRGPGDGFRQRSASRTGLGDRTFDVAVGEAVLTMQPPQVKASMIGELARILRPGGRLGVHEVAYRLDDLDHACEHDDVEQVRIATELTSDLHVPFHALTVPEWRDLLDAQGFTLVNVLRAPLRLLEPERILADEGVVGAARFAANLARDPAARRRVQRMRTVMRRNAPHLRAVALCAVRRAD